MPKIIAVERTGHDLMLVLDNGTRKYCPKTSSNFWSAGGTLITAEPTDPETPPYEPDPDPGAGSGIAQKALQWMLDRQGRFAYSQQNPGRLDPDSTGYGDCSSTCYRAYLTYGVLIGTWTGDQQNYGWEVVPARPGSMWNPGDVLPGDLIFYSWYGNSVGSYDHVDMIVSGDQCIGHGGPGSGPNLQSVTRQLSWSPSIYCVRRYA